MTFVDIDVEHQTHFSILLLNLVFEKYLLASPPENQPRVSDHISVYRRSHLRFMGGNFRFSSIHQFSLLFDHLIPFSVGFYAFLPGLDLPQLTVAIPIYTGSAARGET